MRDPAPMTFTLEDYDRLVDGREDERRFEFVDGQIFAFAGAMPVHNALVSRIVVLLDGTFRSRAGSTPVSRACGLANGSST